MRAIILAAGAALTLTACGGGETEANLDTGNTLEVNTLIVNDTLGADAANMDGNLTTATDPATQNAMVTDLTTNDADTNLANGL